MSSTPIPGLGLSIAFCTMVSLGHLPGCFAEVMPSTTVPPSALHGAEFSCFSLSQLLLYLSPILLTLSPLHHFSSDLQTAQRIHGRREGPQSIVRWGRLYSTSSSPAPTWLPGASPVGWASGRGEGLVAGGGWAGDVLEPVRADQTGQVTAEREVGACTRSGSGGATASRNPCHSPWDGDQGAWP